jgi:hypothetical protein
LAGAAKFVSGSDELASALLVMPDLPPHPLVANIAKPKMRMNLRPTTAFMPRSVPRAVEHL